MAQPNQTQTSLIISRTLTIYLAICTLVIGVILFSAFQHSDNGALRGEIYLYSESIVPNEGAAP